MLIKIVLPSAWGQSLIGKGSPRETAAAIARVTKLLPSLGSPANIVIIPSGTRPAHSHSTSRVSTSDAQVNRARFSGSFSLFLVSMTRILPQWPCRDREPTLQPPLFPRGKTQHRPALDDLSKQSDLCRNKKPFLLVWAAGFAPVTRYEV